jgi:hypothetical protein
MEPQPPPVPPPPSRKDSRLSWPAAAVVLALLALLAWAVVGGVIWSVLR